jgi:hypothetical protein
MNSPFALVLSRIEWNVFGTLTFRGCPEPSEDRQLRIADDWLGRIAHMQRMTPDDLVWCLRVERGEALGRLHLHCLLVTAQRFLGHFCVASGQLSNASKLFRKCDGVCGMTRFRRIEGVNDPALVYTVKDLDGGGDLYELGKTARASRLLFSHKAQRWMSQRRDAGGESGHSSSSALTVPNVCDSNRSADEVGA